MTINYIGLKKINSSIKTIKVTGAKSSALIHSTGIQCLLHLLEVDPKTGNPCMDARPLDQLLQALPNGMRAEGFKIWVQMFSPVRWNGDNQVGVQKETAKGYTPVDVEAANLMPFWAASKENEIRKIAPEFLRVLIEREVKKIKDADDQGRIYDKDGKQTMQLEGNVVELREFAKAAEGFLSTAPHVSKAVHEVKEDKPSVPAAIKAVQHGSPVITLKDTEDHSEPMTGTNG
jgi:hypothetical protein